MAIVQKWKLGQANTLVGTQTTIGTIYPVNSRLHTITVNAGGSTTTTTPRGNLRARQSLMTSTNAFDTLNTHRVITCHHI